jgi:serine/threonine protein kinase/Tfp pilus assembly protein PilF
LAEEPAWIGGEEVPESLGGYVIVRHDDGALWELGRGAMGITYRAQDLSLERQVALKVINADLTLRGAEARARFTREARAAAALRHPNVAIVHQFGVDEQSGHSFYAMELVEGETLEERVCSTGPLEVETVVEIARQVTSALAAAEKRRLVHRDLKPGNIMVCTDDNDKLIAKVIDFGLAKALAETPDGRALTQGGFVGTPAFASPEQLNAGPVDIRADIYSLGATLWYLLTGRMPFGDRADVAPPVEQLKATHVPPRLVSLLVSMLATEPAARPSVHKLNEQLQKVPKGLEARRTRPAWWAAAAAIIALVSAAILWQLRSGSTVPALPEKSIAVLPFSSIGDEKENAYVADGVQDEILTDLTKVADLTVISRRSAAQFRDTKPSVQTIGRALRVSHVLEGTVRKGADRVHVTVHLIDTRTGAETWSEKYERELADIFLIQSDIAQEIVSRLKADLSPREKEAIEAKPTQDMAAYDFYLRARALVYETAGKTSQQAAENANKATELLEQAIARDPNFTLAYCLIADAQLNVASANSWDDRWQKKSEEALNAALRISPNSAEAHLAHARYLIEGLDDPAAGEKDIAIAASGLPGRAAVYSLRAAAEEQRGQWKEALQDCERALELDPREAGPAEDLSQLLITLRRYPQAERLADHMIATLPKETSPFFWRLKSWIVLARGDTKGAMAALDASPSRHLGLIMLNQLVANLHVMQHDYLKAEEFYQSIIGPGNIPYVLPNQGQGTQLFLRGAAFESLGRLARFRGEKEKARKYFAAARPYFEQWLAHAPDVNARWGRANAQAYLAQIDAGLGHKEEAIREGKKVVEFWSLQDARVAPDTKIRLAIVYLWSGEREAALRELSQVAKGPAWIPFPPFCPGMSAGDLKLNPLWDELRGDPRFKKLIAEAARPIPL